MCDCGRIRVWLCFCIVIGRVGRWLYLFIFLADQLFRLRVRYVGSCGNGEVCATLSSEFAVGKSTHTNSLHACASILQCYILECKPTQFELFQFDSLYMPMCKIFIYNKTKKQTLGFSISFHPPSIRSRTLSTLLSI